MAHEIDFTTGRAGIAFVGETPWHGLGQELTPNADMVTWRREAGLDYEVRRSAVMYEQPVADAHNVLTMPDRHVLYRSDSGAPLSVVSKDYKVVQPAEVMDFFARLSEIGGFQMETAGALSDGKRIWALAKVNDGAPVIGHDVVRPYVLLATSYDGTMATTAKFTTIRVVCNNTLTMSIGRGEEGFGKQESDRTGAVSTMVRIPHSVKFDEAAVRRDLGIAGDAFDRWLINTRLTAERAMSADDADLFLHQLLAKHTPKPEGKVVDVRSTRGYKRIMELFSGAAMGSDMAGQTRWGMVNAVTQFVDHERGRTDDSRLSSAWFGVGESIKNEAYALATEAA